MTNFTTGKWALQSDTELFGYAREQIIWQITRPTDAQVNCIFPAQIRHNSNTKIHNTGKQSHSVVHHAVTEETHVQ